MTDPELAILPVMAPVTSTPLARAGPTGISHDRDVAQIVKITSQSSGDVDAIGLNFIGPLSVNNNRTANCDCPRQSTADINTVRAG